MGPESRLLPEMLGEELWEAAKAELVELNKAEFAEALETIGARDNFGLDPKSNGFVLSYIGIWDVVAQAVVIGQLTRRYSEVQLISFSILAV